MKSFFALFISTISCIQTIALPGEPKYPVSDIPDSLSADVNAVIREHKIVYTILSTSKATHYVRLVVTIFNEKGKDYATEVVGYDKLSKIKDFNGAVYDASGKQIKRLKNNEIYDQSAFDGFSLYSDYRLKAVSLAQGTYPYTVEFEYEKEYKYLYDIPDAIIIPDVKVSVQKSSYQLIYPKPISPRFKTYNVTVQPKIETQANGNESVFWMFEGLHAIQLEPGGLSLAQVVPRIVAAPGKFEYEGYEGDMSTWESYARWQRSLNKGRDVLPDELRTKIHELVKGQSTTEDKVRVLYDYLQNSTRYVNITLGIGGLQPFEASVVTKNGYGDCKALSNYMIAMLKEVGIQGYYTKIAAGSNALPLDEDFPSHQTNHIIVAVPNKADTIWLECTSQNNPFNYLGAFTGDRKAFMITENGGALVYTHRYTAEQNLQCRKADVYVTVSGDAQAIVKTVYSGLQYENHGLNLKLGNQFDEQKKWIQEHTNIPSFDINSFSISEHKDKIPSAIVNLDLSLKRYATVSGKRIFLSPNLMNRSLYVPENVPNRKTNVVQSQSYTHIDTIRYHLPEGIYPEFVPQPARISSQFGEYESFYKVDQGSLVYIRKLKKVKGIFPAASYNELVEFHRGIMKSDQTKLVFMSKT